MVEDWNWIIIPSPSLHSLKKKNKKLGRPWLDRNIFLKTFPIKGLLPLTYKVGKILCLFLKGTYPFWKGCRAEWIVWLMVSRYRISIFLHHLIQTPAESLFLPVDLYPSPKRRLGSTSSVALGSRTLFAPWNKIHVLKLRCIGWDSNSTPPWQQAYNAMPRVAIMNTQ